MSTPVKRKITLELNPNKKVLPKDRPSVFQRLGTKKFQTSVTGGSGPVKLHQEQDSTVNKEEIVKRIVGCDDPEPVPPPKIVPESVSAHARLIEAQLAAKLGKVIVSRGETIGAVVGPSNVGNVSNRSEAERGSGGGGGGGGHSVTSTIERGGPGGGSSSAPSGGGGGGGGWDQSSLENADQDILERKRKELQHELKLEMDASGGGSSHHHHHHHSSSSMMKQKSAKETLVVKKIRKVPAPRRSSSSSDSSSSSGSDSSDSDSSSSSSSSSRDSRRVKKRAVRQRRDSSSSSDGGGGKKVAKKHVKKVSADGTKRIVTKKIGGHLTKIRVKKVTSPGGTTSHIRKVAREVSPSGKTPTKYTVKKVVALKKEKHVAVVDARERVREKERELALREKEREREKERLRLREREREREHVKSRSPRAHIRSRSPRARISPTVVPVSARGREKKKSPEGSRYREPVAAVVRRPERSPERIDDRRRHETLKDRERRERQERGELARTKEREEALARCQERQRERERLAAAKERPAPRRERENPVDGGLDKPDRHRPVERLLPRPAERARALAAARSPGKIDHDRSRTPNSPRSRDRLAPRERSFDRGVVERGFIEHHDRRTRSREREYVAPIVRGARSRDSPYDRHAAAPARDTREYREPEGRPAYDRERGRSQDYGRTEYPDDPPPRRELDREWERNREPDRAPPAPRTYERREEHGRDWDREHCRPPHSHSHEPDSYQGPSRNWDESRWKEADGWVNEKERNEWKFKERAWEHDDHPAVGPPTHSHSHSGGRRWQHTHPEPNQGPNWHGKPKEDMEFGPRHKLAGRLGDRVGNDNTMFRRQHQGHQPMFQRHGRNGPPAGIAPGRFGNQNKYSINRTQQNLAAQHQHPHQHPPLQQRQQQEQQTQGSQPIGPGPSNQLSQSGPAQPGPLMIDSNVQPPVSTPTTTSNEPKDDLPPLIHPIPQVSEGIPAVKPVEESQTQQSPLTVVTVTTAAPVDSATSTGPAESVESTDNAAIPDAVEQGTVANAAATTEKPPEPVAAPPEPMDEDNLSEISDDPDDILTREEEITNQLNDSTGGADGKPSTGDSNIQDSNNPMNVGFDALQPNMAQHQQQAGSSDASGNAAAFSALEVKDPKEAGKLHANKELKEEMDLDFEEISDGELEEENKFKGLGDALGVDWASLAQETRAKLKPEQTIPVSARNRWKAHHILLDIGISVRLAGEAYAQRVLTESKEKLREEIEEFKAAAEQQKVAAVKKEEEEQLFNGVKIKKEILDEEERKEQQTDESAVKKEDSNENNEVSEQEANLADIDKILHPVASVHVAMRERARARRNLILCAAGPHSRALSARRDLEIRRQLCGFPPQECNERITEHQSTPTNPELHETVMKLYQATMQQKKIEVQ
ncbi:fl(2)d-associated complex component-like isoform X2 [Ochlerotatus camptorhynchus]|uniref:fl(2)d-associated complex component-like isoform X2 n=1 Tax=Ochlerotatus camptorhynchus TaxID=644619 RepID=UPI0031D4DA3F